MYKSKKVVFQTLIQNSSRSFNSPAWRTSLANQGFFSEGASPDFQSPANEWSLSNDFAKSFYQEIKHNFNGGPGTLPKPMLEKVQSELRDYKGLGISVLEMTHYQPEFIDLMSKLINDFRRVMKIPENFRIILQQGGATQQFSAVPLNLTGHVFGDSKYASANFLISGQSSQEAANEASQYHRIHKVNPGSILDLDSYTFDPNAQYFHICQNEANDGVEFNQKMLTKILDKLTQEVPNQIVTCDMSSAIGSRNLAKLWQRFGVVYAGDQKSIGTSGVTFVIIREDILDRLQATPSRIPIPAPLDWNRQTIKDSFLNTPSVLSIYTSQLICEHMLTMGGITWFEKQANKKSKLLYKFLDSTIKKEGNIQFRNRVDKKLRSRINIPFNLTDKMQNVKTEAELNLLRSLNRAGFSGLDGHHKTYNGLIANINNSMEYEEVEALAKFLEKEYVALNQ